MLGIAQFCPWCKMGNTLAPLSMTPIEPGEVVADEVVLVQTMYRLTCGLCSWEEIIDEAHHAGNAL